MKAVAPILYENYEKLLWPLKDDHNSSTFDMLNCVMPQSRRSIEHYLHAIVDHQTRKFLSCPISLESACSGESWDWHWMKPAGKYRGTFPKRVAQFVRETYNVKLSAEQVSHIGNLAVQGMLRSDNAVVDFTTDFGWDAGDFNDGDSCYWSDRWMCKGTIKLAGGWAMHYYLYDKETKEYQGMGRSWMIPDVPETGSILFFNIYGGMNKTSFLRLAAMCLEPLTGCKYELVNYVSIGSNTDEMWFNDDSCGHLLVPSSRAEAMLRLYKQGDARINLDWRKFERQSIAQGMYRPDHYDEDDDYDENDNERW